jgi:hypothetical protein
MISLGLFAQETIRHQINYTIQPTVNESPVLAANSSNFPSSFTPYIVTFAISNQINLTNGNYQYYAPTSATTIWMPDMPSNFGYSFRIDVNPGTNSFSFGTNNLCFTTNDVIGVGASTIRIRTNEATPLVYDKAYNSTNWRVINL